MARIKPIAFITAFFVMVLPALSLAGTVDLPKTGQTTCYDQGGNVIECAGTGQDGDIQAGVEWPEPRFVDNGDGTVTDNLTGLMWLKDGNCFGPRTWQGALDVIAGFNTNPGNYSCTDYTANYTDWVLPNIVELESLINSEESPLAAWLNSQGFAMILSMMYWSATTGAFNTDSAWYINMSRDYVYDGYYKNKSRSYYIWPVRAVQSQPARTWQTGQKASYEAGDDGDLQRGVSWPSPRFTDNDDGTVTDNLTGLMWLKDGNCFGVRTWQGALDVVADFNTNPGNYSCSAGGYDDWRLPNRKELFSIIDFSRCNPALPQGHPFFNVSWSFCWSATTVQHTSGASNTSDAWAVFMPRGCWDDSGKALYNGVWPVRTGHSGPFVDLLKYLSYFFGLDTPSGYSPEPVNAALGNYVYQHTDLKVHGRNLDFEFRQAYNSQDSYYGPFGYGWTHTYNIILTENSDGSVKIKYGDGHVEYYDPSTNGAYTPKFGGTYNTLVKNADETFTVTTRNQFQYSFSDTGRLTSIKDKNGNSINLSYSSGNLSTITDTVGRTFSLGYDSNHRLTGITDPLGRVLSYSYDSDGNLVSFTDAEGGVWNYSYDSNHQITCITNPEENDLVTNEYTLGKVKSQTDARGHTTTFQYPNSGNTTVTDPQDRTTIYTHDDELRLIQETDARGNSIHKSYDNNHNITQIIDKKGNAKSYSYDDRGNIIQKIDPLGNNTTNTYDNDNNLISRTDPSGNTTIYDYNSNGNLITETDALGNLTTYTYTDHSQLKTKTNANGNTWTYSYDSFGNLVEVKDPQNNATTYTYDQVGRKLTKTDAKSHTTTYTYDNNDNLLTVTDPLGHTTSYSYDDNANQISVTDPKGNKTLFGYDANDQLISVTNALGETTTYTYDWVGNKTSTTDPLGRTTSYSYDEVGNLKEVQNAMGNHTTYTYDANGNQLTVTNANSHTTGMSYDVLNRLTAVTDSLEHSVTRSYDALGRLISETNAKGQTTTYTYNALGRLIKVTDASAQETIYVYDAVGNRISMTNATGNTWTKTYNSLNQLVEETDPAGSSTTYSYDPVGNLLTKTTPNGNIITYTYDANDRLIKVHYPDSSEVQFSYDANGNCVSMTDKHGTTSYSYDALNRLVEVTDTFGNTVQYAYDKVGNQIKITYPDVKEVDYSYDDLNRLQTVTDWLGHETTYSYDSAGNVISMQYPNGSNTNYTYDFAERLTGLENKKSDSSQIASYSYALDAMGNHIDVDRQEPLSPSFQSKNIAYVYDTDNRILSSNSITYTHDANGNLLSSSDGENYTWDYEDRLIQANGKNYLYNGSGQRIGAGNTRYVLDVTGSMTQVLAETDSSGNILSYYVYGLGLISEIQSNGDTYYYYGDSRGSTIAMLDHSESLVNAYSYSPFGEIVNQVESVDNDFKYVGRHGVMHEGDGLYFMRARYYDAETGRFLSKDPVEGKVTNPTSLHKYVYVRNDPINLIDTTGHECQRPYGTCIPPGFELPSNPIPLPRNKEPLPEQVQYFRKGGAGIIYGEIITFIRYPNGEVKAYKQEAFGGGISSLMVKVGALNRRSSDLPQKRVTLGGGASAGVLGGGLRIDFYSRHRVDIEAELHVFGYQILRPEGWEGFAPGLGCNFFYAEGVTEALEIDPNSVSTYANPFGGQPVIITPEQFETGQFNHLPESLRNELFDMIYVK